MNKNDSTQRPSGSRAQHRVRTVSVAALLVMAIAGCDVTNPGPVQDEFLNLNEAHAAMVNGAQRQITWGLNWIVLHTAHSAREYVAGGQTGPGGVLTTAQNGQLLPQDGGVNEVWQAMHQGRWIAEDAIRRFTDGELTSNVSANTLVDAYLWAGYANKILGENMCASVFDGGPAGDASLHSARAEQHFTSALAGGPSADQRLAALAGRAATRMFMGDWAGAVTDATAVPLDYTKFIEVDATAAEQTENVIWAGTFPAYGIRAQSVHFTWFYDYFTDTGDPRAAWDIDPARPIASANLTGFGAVPWSFPTNKHITGGEDIRLAGGTEMVLIRAEALLRDNNMQGAMDLINSIRTAVISETTMLALDPWTATTMEEAWTALKRERAIEFWLEGKRMADIRRWSGNVLTFESPPTQIVPGILDWPDWEGLLGFFFQDNKPSKCFPIPDDELDTNLNLESR